MADMIVGAMAYLVLGCVLACLLDGSIRFRMPRWLQIPLIVLLWPLAILAVLWALIDWIAEGSH